MGKTLVGDIEMNRKSDDYQQIETFRNLISENTVESIVVVQNGVMVFCNSKTTDLTGYSEKELLSIPFTEFIYPEDRQLIVDRHQKRLKGEETENRYRFRLLRKDGSVYWVEINTLRIEWEGSPATLSFMSDVTQRRETEEALRKSEMLYRSILHASPDDITITDVDGKIRLVSPAGIRLFGYEDSEKILEKSILDFLVPEDRDRANEDIHLILEGNFKGPVEYKAVRADGTLFAIETNAEVIHGEDGAPLGVVFIVRDITDRKKTEEVLNVEQILMNNLMNSMPDKIYFKDRESRFIRINNATANLMAVGTPEDAIGNTDFDYFTEEHARPAYEDEQKIIQTGLPIRKEEKETIAGKPDCWVLTTKLPLLDKNGEIIGTFGTSTDITDRKLVLDELQEMNMQLEKSISQANTLAVEAEMANIAKSEFLANMSHEIRTPMNGVIGMTGLLLDTNLDDEQRRYAEIIRSSGENLLTLINDILDFSKIEAGKLELEVMNFDLMSMLDDFAAALAVRAQEKGLEFICGADPDVPALLKGDPGRLRQVLTNLVGNAVKFTAQGEVAVHVRCLSKTEDEAELQFSVCDTGIGIPPDKIDLIFNKFTQADASTTRQFGGTGLGLAISKQLAELMGGDIGVKSNPGTGSEFWFTARVKIQPEGSENKIPAPANLKGVRILIVDDNATNREMLTIRMTSWGMRPVEVPDGPSALVALNTALSGGDPFKIAVLDMHMPGMDGAMLAQSIKNDKKLANIPLVLLTSLGERGEGSHFESIGFAGYLVKPLRHIDLFNVLSATLATHGKGDDGKTGGSVDSLQIVTRHSAREIVHPSIDLTKRILLVEDNIINQQVALGFLKKLGLKADATANGEEALIALENIPYDLVLMDVQMPVMDGFEATRRIRDKQSNVLNREIPIIAMTANALQGDRDNCLRAGMSDYVSKPIEPQKLAEVLQSWLPANERGQEPIPEKTKKSVTPKEGDNPIDVFDKSALMRRLMDDEELANTILGMFMDETPIQIRNLKDCLEKGDKSGIELHSHTIKGSSANIGGEALRAAALVVEKSIKSGDMEGARRGLPDIEQQYARLKDVLQKELG